MRKNIILIIALFHTILLFSQNNSEDDFWLENEKIKKQFLKTNQEIQSTKHQLDSLNGAYVNLLLQGLKSVSQNIQTINEGHDKFIYQLFQNKTDTANFIVIKNIDYYFENKLPYGPGNSISNIYLDIELGFHLMYYPIFYKIYKNSNTCFTNNYIFYFVNKFPVEEIQGDLKMKMWIKIFQENKPFFNECCNNYNNYSDKAKLEKLNEIRKIVNGE